MFGCAWDGWEYEFHLCSDICYDFMKAKRKPELKKIALSILNPSPAASFKG